MKQSRAMSLVEAATNVVVGYVLAIATQNDVFSWSGKSDARPCFAVNWIKMQTRRGHAPRDHKGPNAANEVNP